MYQNLLSLFIFFSHFQIFPNAFAANILDAVSIFAKTAFHQEGQGEETHQTNFLLNSLAHTSSFS